MRYCRVLASLIIFTIVALAFYKFWATQPAFDAPNNGRTGMREQFIEINSQFKALLGNRAQMVNVGSRPNCACGDLVNVALGKVNYNLALVREQRGVK